MAFERFTVKARQVVVTAQEEARLLKHHHIGTEHLLLGLLDVPDGLAAKALHQLGYQKETAQADVAAVVAPGKDEARGHIAFTPRAKKVLENALHESTRLHHNYIGTEHILLALISEREGVAAQVLAQRIEPIGKVRDAVLAGLSGVTAGAWPAGTPATDDTVSAARALAGGAPVGSHHLLEALLRAENSMAAKVLRELGVDPDVVAAKIDELDPETTTDANPEEAAARRMEIRLVDDEVHVILRDPATVAIAGQITELSGGPILGVGPVAGMFVPLWRSASQVLLQVRRALEPAPEETDASPAGKAAEVVRRVLAPRLRRRAG